MPKVITVEYSTDGGKTWREATARVWRGADLSVPDGWFTRGGGGIDGDARVWRAA